MDGDVDEEEAKGAEVVGYVEDSALDMMDFDLFIFVCSSSQHKAPHGNHALSLVEEPAFGGASGHQKRGSKTDEDGEKALEEEDVAPGMDDH